LKSFRTAPHLLLQVYVVLILVLREDTLLSTVVIKTWGNTALLGTAGVVILQQRNRNLTHNINWT